MKGWVHASATSSAIGALLFNTVGCLYCCVHHTNLLQLLQCFNTLCHVRWSHKQEQHGSKKIKHTQYSP